MNEVAGLPVVFYIALALLVMASFYAWKVRSRELQGSDDMKAFSSLALRSF